VCEKYREDLTRGMQWLVFPYSTASLNTKQLGPYNIGHYRSSKDWVSEKVIIDLEGCFLSSALHLKLEEGI
jgi:hypothetical protein